ncbi:MAG: acyl-CoA mutase large subunit family protein [Deltaproteobacteria bacterium]|nr:acyl-CoA mutase large subunit family protein [Deltaproteobacteria bacterium]MBW2075351.1 acyl-CoA mutase large subunit family protein [Deltaproteobacteria bacterium]
MANDIKQKAEKAYREKSEINSTASGIPLKSFYTAEDIKEIDLEKECGWPGEYPFTRGIYSDMFRGRLWSARELCGYASPEMTNKRIKFLLESGERAINFISDLPCANGIDSDHPRAKNDIGRQGVPISTIEDAQRLIDGIPLDKISVNATVGAISIYVAAAKTSGYPPSVLRGTTVNDCLHFQFCGFYPPSWPLTWGFRECLDWIEYCIKEAPKFNPLSIDVYDFRENGITAIMEVAFAMSEAKEYIKALIDRGLDIDDVAPRVGTITHSCAMNFFEEIAKLRAARRIWSKMLKEEFGAKSDRSLKYKYHVHTAGDSLTLQQPMVNIIRIAYEALAAVLSGCQSLHTCSYDEALGLPTEQAHELAIRTQQVLSYETGVTSVSDPLGGSYYIEWLTSEIEKRILEYMEEIDKQGGMKNAIETGWIENEIKRVQYEKQKEIEEGKRIIVGVNRFRKSIEEEKIPPAHEVPAEEVEKHLANLKRFRKNRNGRKVSESLENLYKQAKDPRKILIYPEIEAAEAGATHGEIRGTIRMAYGEHFDPFGQIEPTFDASFVEHI